MSDTTPKFNFRKMKTVDLLNACRDAGIDTDAILSRKSRGKGYREALVGLLRKSQTGQELAPPKMVDTGEGLVAAEKAAKAAATPAVRLAKAPAIASELEFLWMAIVLHTDAISYGAFDNFISRVLGNGDPAAEAPSLSKQIANLKKQHIVPGSELYNLLKTAAETFLLVEGGVVHSASGEYLRNVSIRAPRDPITGQRAKRPIPDVPDSIDRLHEGRPLSYVDAESRLSRFLGTDGTQNNYIRAIIRSAFPNGRVDLPSAFSTLSKTTYVSAPCLLELIWSYWMEEAMLCQTMNALTLRFQNVRRAGAGADPLANMEMASLHAMSGLLWGYIQDEPHRLTVARRAYEYAHEYGLTLIGRAVPSGTAADPRSTFIQAFHNLLRECDIFMKQDNDMTIDADAFGVLNCVKQVHMILAEGAHNQFRDLPWTARAEMLLQQWVLARPEMREFLHGRPMVAYREDWMGSVDAMKKLQGWGPANTMQFADLARFGERILLSLRYYPWNNVADQNVAKSWVRFWREELQGYVHAYHAVCGVNLTDTPVIPTAEVDGRYLAPSVHLRKRLVEARSKQQT